MGAGGVGALRAPRTAAAMRAVKAFVNMVVNKRVWGLGGGRRKERRGSGCGVRRADEGGVRRAPAFYACAGCGGWHWGGSLGVKRAPPADMA